MAATSLLPVLASDLSVLDMCAGLGGKSLAMVQTKYPERITCNDTSYERVRRIIFCPIFVVLLQVALFLWKHDQLDWSNLI